MGQVAAGGCRQDRNTEKYNERYNMLKDTIKMGEISLLLAPNMKTMQQTGDLKCGRKEVINRYNKVKTKQELERLEHKRLEPKT